MTPPQNCGLLKGTMREEMICELNAREEPFGQEDLRAADQIIVTNSVQGALRAELIEGVFPVTGLPLRELEHVTR